MAKRIRLSVIGSVNLDIVAHAKSLPGPGETVTGATIARHPGGKGANMALAAQRLGADVCLTARVGDDMFADEALHLLQAAGVDLSETRAMPDTPTGVALIAVSDDGENQIVVASGANHSLTLDAMTSFETDAVLSVLEVPLETVIAASRKARGFFAVNLAPALPVPDELLQRADLIIVNEGEAAIYGDALNNATGLLAITYGARGAMLYRQGEILAEVSPPRVNVVDTTGAGDTFSAALTVALCEAKSPQDALSFAATASALAVSKQGAQPSLPMRADVEALLS